MSRFLVDDFLAVGNALHGLISLVEQAGATLVGAAIEIEKAFQGGGDKLRAQGIRVESLAMIDRMTDTEVIFRWYLWMIGPIRLIIYIKKIS